MNTTTKLIEIEIGGYTVTLPDGATINSQSFDDSLTVPVPYDLERGQAMQWGRLPVPKDPEGKQLLRLNSALMKMILQEEEEDLYSDEELDVICQTVHAQNGDRFSDDDVISTIFLMALYDAYEPEEEEEKEPLVYLVEWESWSDNIIRTTEVIVGADEDLEEAMDQGLEDWFKARWVLRDANYERMLAQLNSTEEVTTETHSTFPVGFVGRDTTVNYE